MTEPATAIFVHGGWHDSWSWHLVQELLNERGVPSAALDLPMRTLAEDAAVLRTALEATEGPAVVVSHSWGGSVATLGAADSPNAAHLIYIAGVLTDIGHPTPAPGAAAAARPSMRSKVVIETETTTVIDKQASLEVFYHDVDPALARQAAARLRPFQKTGYEVVQTELVPAWRTTPTTYVVCANDRMIHQDNQRDMAAAAGAEVVEWPTSHSPFLSRPDLVARLVAIRAAEVTA